MTASLNTAASYTASFTPQAGRPYNVQVAIAGTASCVLQRSLDSGVSWFAKTAAGGSTLYAYTVTGALTPPFRGRRRS